MDMNRCKDEMEKAIDLLMDSEEEPPSATFRVEFSEYEVVQTLCLN